MRVLHSSHFDFLVGGLRRGLQFVLRGRGGVEYGSRADVGVHWRGSAGMIGAWQYGRAVQTWVSSTFHFLI